MPAPPLSLRIHRFAQYPLFVLILFCRAPTSPRTSHVSTFCRLYSLRQCRGAHFLSHSFHVEQERCRPPKPLRLSGFWLLCIFMHCIFHAFRTFCMICLVSLLQFFSAVAACLSPLNGFVFAAAPMRFSCFAGAPVHRFFVVALFSLCVHLVNRFAFLLCSLTADAFCLRRIFAEPPRDCRSLFRHSLSFSLFPTLPFCLTPLFFYYIII